nr:MAG TPA: hypothetical protein [Caudoviricetes sp.]
MAAPCLQARANGARPMKETGVVTWSGRPCPDHLRPRLYRASGVARWCGVMGIAALIWQMLAGQTRTRTAPWIHPPISPYQSTHDEQH